MTPMGSTSNHRSDAAEDLDVRDDKKDLTTLMHIIFTITALGCCNEFSTIPANCGPQRPALGGM
jgi:hypothetical protein